MAHVESTQPTQPILPRSGSLRRMWWPIGAVTISALGMICAQMFPGDVLDAGNRRLISFLLALLGLAAVAAWFFVGSGAARRSRLIGAVLLVGGFLGLFAAIRRVEFSGDMVPTFDFRWQTDRNVALEAHRAAQLKDTAESARLPGAPAEALPIRFEPGVHDVLDFRGPRRDGVVEQPVPLRREWTTRPPGLIFRQPVGGGYASFLHVAGTLITIEQRRDSEAVVAYDADNGRERWVHAYPALFHETAGGDGPRATPTLYQGKVYALGATGELTCLDFVSGKPDWALNILKDNECENLTWAMSGSPLVYDDVVLVNPGTQKGTPASRAIVAYGLDGKRRFASGTTISSYCSPMLVTLAGVRQVLIFDGVGLAGYDPGDGTLLWSFPWKTDFDVNAAQPIVIDANRVLITSAAGTALVNVERVDGQWKPSPIWHNRRLKGGYSNALVYQGHVYGIDENIMTCLDVETGKPRWKERAAQFGHGQMLLNGDLILVLGEAGELAMVEAVPDKYHELARIQAIEGKTWNVPILVGRRIFVRNHLEMAAYDLPLADEPASVQP